MDSRKTIFRFSLYALFIFMIFSFCFAFFNTQISNFTRSVLALSGDIKIKKIEYNPAAEELTKDKKRMEMTKRMVIPVAKKPGTAAAAQPAKPLINRTEPARKGFYIENADNTDPKAVMRIESKDQVVLNQDSWKGPRDLQATCVLLKDSKGLIATINVLDDKLIAESSTSYQNDCIELYFDFRPQASRAKEQYEKGVFQAIAVPYFSKSIPNTIHFYNGNSNIDVTVKGAKVKSEKTTNGYVIRIFFPLEGLKAIGIVPEKEFNFDFGVIDVDDDNKKTQLMWSGTADNCRSAKWFGQLKPAE